MTKVVPRTLTPDGFAQFGSVVQLGDVEPTAMGEAFSYWSDIAHFEVDGETEVGFCKVYPTDGSPVSWMERHERTPELLIPIDAPFVLPVMTSDKSSVHAFIVPIGEAVVVGQNVWHSACHPVDADSATYFVIFRRGTPQDDVYKTDVSGVALSNT